MGSGNLRKHLYRKHPDEYDKAAVERGWTNKQEQQMEDVSIQTHAARQDVLPYSQEAFMEYLVRFIVADDQVTATVLHLHSSLKLYLSSRFVL